MMDFPPPYAGPGGPPMMPPGAPFPPPMMPPIPYEVAAHQVGSRFMSSEHKRMELTQGANMATNGEFERRQKEAFSASHKAGYLDETDWRVPQLQYRKDPKFNAGVHPAFAFEFQERKIMEGRMLEDQLAREAFAKSSMEMSASGSHPPPQEIIIKGGTPFMHAVPYYQRDDDVWQRRMHLRSMDEAMRGDVSKPLPRPVLFAEDFSNFRSGKYVKDDCPIA
mmetsp:Transcript_70981/g.154243  ORF Transcript_70981/g.154243 Transcript_70981/m.154243 type:complete len:222 (+) Transcript_70981:118-783(+)|eukprot:CAMPEP_0170586968 /NCGR_PEP_ID=MMETSP0224-20130122/10028_1 /TAXON_ID=285029 /ORGANISM="Togula jolla, Strain CCCM 725" /LENGTH=221 /DNA_ID=CAMNT_0010910551 /DNA_START=45 /DNA_END=710 /DNA_ORIENTATION=+